MRPPVSIVKAELSDSVAIGAIEKYLCARGIKATIQDAHVAAVLAVDTLQVVAGCIAGAARWGMGGVGRRADFVGASASAVVYVGLKATRS